MTQSFSLPLSPRSSQPTTAIMAESKQIINLDSDSDSEPIKSPIKRKKVLANRFLFSSSPSSIGEENGDDGSESDVIIPRRRRPTMNNNNILNSDLETNQYLHDQDIEEDLEDIDDSSKFLHGEYRLLVASI